MNDYTAEKVNDPGFTICGEVATDEFMERMCFFAGTTCRVALVTPKPASDELVYLKHIIPPTSKELQNSLDSPILGDGDTHFELLESKNDDSKQLAIHE